jgi:translocation and assembly module TamB
MPMRRKFPTRLIPSSEPESEPTPEPEPDSSPPGFNVRVNAFDLTGGIFSFRQRPKHHGYGDIVDIVVLDDIDISLTAADLAGQSGRLAVSINGGRMDMADIRTGLKKFHLHAGLDQGRLTPLDIDILLADGTALTLTGAVDRMFDQPEIGLEMAFQAELSDIGRILDLGIDLTGPVDLHLTASGAAADPEVALSIRYGSGVIAGLPIADINLAARMSERRVHLQRLSAETDAGDMDITGTISVQEAFPDGFMAGYTEIDAITCSLFLNADLPNLARLSDVFDISGPRGAVSLTADISGSAVMPDIALNLNGKALAWQDIRIGDLLADAGMDLQQGTLGIERISLNNRRSSFRLSGAAGLFSPGSYELLNDPIFNLELTDGVLFADDFSDDIEGRLAFGANISGSMRQPSATLFIRGDGIAARNQKIGDLTADLSLDEGRVTIAPLKIVNNKSTLMLTGSAHVLAPVTAEIMDDPAIDITLSGDSVRIKDFFPDLAGLVSVNGHILGSLKQPRGHLRLLADDLDLGVQQIRQINLNVRLDQTIVHIDPLKVLLAPDQAVTLTGWVNMKKKYNLQLISDPISPNAINALAEVFPEGGRVQIEGSGEGTLDDPQAEAKIRISDLLINGSTLPSLNIGLSVADQIAHIRGTSPSGDHKPDAAAESLSMEGRLHIKNQDFTIRVGMDRMDLAPYLEMASQPELSGQLTARVNAGGNLFALDQVRAELHIADLSLFRNELEILRSSDFQTAFDNGLLSIPGSRVTLLSEGFLNIHGTGRVNGNLDLHADGSVPVSLAESFTDAVTDTSGTIDISAGISGTASDPAIAADIFLKNISLTLPETAQRLHEVNGGIHITSDRVAIRNVKGRLDAGDFSISGDLDLADFQPVRADIAINARAFPIKVPDTLDLTINAGIKLSGDNEKSMLSGDIILLDGLYYRDIEFSLMDAAGDIGRGRREFSPPPETESEGLPLLNKLALDINVRHRNPFMVDNNMAVLRIRPDLRIYGTPNHPLISGRAQVTDGVITFYNTEFTVQKGIIDFINPYKIEPTIDIAAQSQVRHWTINLAVTGPPDDLRVLLSSSPAEEHGDIVSLLVVGKTTRELAGGEGGGASSPQQLLANLLAEQLQKNLQAGTGLDIIELEYTTNGESDTGDDIRVTVGKEISRRLTLLYGVEQRSGLVVQKSTAIYKLLENLSVNAFQDTEGAFGGEMRYRLEFR